MTGLIDFNCTKYVGRILFKILLFNQHFWLSPTSTSSEIDDLAGCLNGVVVQTLAFKNLSYM